MTARSKGPTPKRSYAPGAILVPIVVKRQRKRVLGKKPPKNLIAMANSPNPLRRKWAASVLGSRRQATGIPLLKKLAGDTHPIVRSSAVAAAGSIGTAKAMEIANSALKDPDTEVRRTAVSVISEQAEKKSRIRKRPPY